MCLSPIEYHWNALNMFFPKVNAESAIIYHRKLWSLGFWQEIVPHPGDSDNLLRTLRVLFVNLVINVGIEWGIVTTPPPPPPPPPPTPPPPLHGPIPDVTLTGTPTVYHVKHIKDCANTSIYCLMIKLMVVLMHRVPILLLTIYVSLHVFQIL